MDSPKGAGLYWYQEYSSGPSEIVEVRRIGSGLIKWFYFRIGDEHSFPVEPGRGRWEGPLTAPWCSGSTLADESSSSRSSRDGAMAQGSMV